MKKMLNYVKTRAEVLINIFKGVSILGIIKVVFDFISYASSVKGLLY